MSPRAALQQVARLVSRRRGFCRQEDALDPARGLFWGSLIGLGVWAGLAGLLVLLIAGCAHAEWTPYIIPADVLTGASGGSSGPFDLDHARPFFFVLVRVDGSDLLVGPFAGATICKEHVRLAQEDFEGRISTTAVSECFAMAPGGLNQTVQPVPGSPMSADDILRENLPPGSVPTEQVSR